MKKRLVVILSLVLMLNMMPACLVYADTASDVDSAKAERDKAAAELQESETALAEANKKVDEAQAAYDAAAAKNPEAVAALEEAEKKQADAAAAVDNAQTEYESAFINAEKASAEATAAKEERNAAIKDKKAAKKDLRDKEKALKKAGQDNEEAKTQYEKAAEDLANIELALAAAEKKKLDADAAKLKADTTVIEKAVAVKEAQDDKEAADKALTEGSVGKLKTAKDSLNSAKTEAQAAETRRDAAKTSLDEAQKKYDAANEEAIRNNKNVGPGTSKEATEAAIANMTSDKDLPGAVFNKLRLRSQKQTKSSITITWKKVKGVKRYVIYGNKCGKKNKLKRLAAVKNNNSKSYSKKFSKVLGKKLKKGTYYKFMIVALDKDNNVVSSSKIIHVATKGGKVGNASKVTTRAKKNKVSVKKGKTFKLAARQVPASKKLKVKVHRKLSYESTKPKVATVTKKGVIKAKKKGTCYVYAYAQNGVFTRIKVTVK